MAVPTLVLRRAQLLSWLDLGTGRGLEIGPLSSPVVTPDMAEVYYVDVFSREELRAHYAPDPGVDPDTIPEIDFVLSTSGGIQSLTDAVRPASPFDWVVASHVVEHVPDLVAWLAQIADVLNDDGKLLLAVPDRRFTFDANRPPTTVGQVLQAHDGRDHSPSVRAVYDMYREAVNVTARAAWAGAVVGKADRVHTLDYVLSQIERARDGTYVDSHVWTFTPGEFVEQFAELGELGLCDFVVEEIVPTAPNQIEFYVTLRRLPRGISTADAAAARSHGVRSLTDTAAGSQNAAAAELSQTVARLASETLRCEELERELAAAARQAADDLFRVKTSERWRVGGLLVAPGAFLKRVIGRRTPREPLS